jgi:hypothetical protein
MRSSRSTFAAIALLFLLGIPAWASAAIPMALGGGFTVGGYLGDLSHQWKVGPGGTLFAQAPIGRSFEARLGGAMQWSDGDLRAQDPAADLPDFGAHAGDLARSYRRTSITASLIYRIDSSACRDYVAPYVGAGVGRYESRVTFDTTPIAGRREATGWDSGVHGLAGIRFYRTSGVFFSIEAMIHGIDTPREWTAAYDGTFLMGVEIGP